MPFEQVIMSKQDEEYIEELKSKLRGFISEYIEDYVIRPTLQLADDPIREEQLSGCNLLIHTIISNIIETGVEYDKEFLRTLTQTEIETRIRILERAIETESSEYEKQDALNYLASDSSRKYLFSYLGVAQK